MTLRRKNIGIYTGTFDPIHHGHLGFIDAAIRENALDIVYIIPERRTHHKKNVTAYHHRLAMVRYAVSGRAAKVVKVHNEYVSFDTVKKLTTTDDEVHLMLGTDAALTLRTWNNLDLILKQMKLIVGVRDKNDSVRVHTLMDHLNIAGAQYSLIETMTSAYQSSAVRTGEQPFLPEIVEYVQKHRLYRI